MRLSRRQILQTPLALWAMSRATSAQRSPRRRALVVGIDKYSPPIGSNRAASAVTDVPVPRVPVQGPPHRADWTDLAGSVNDARLMSALFESRFGFARSNIVHLENHEATADRILREFRRHLVEAGVAGDIAVFFFAGHGSQMVNTASNEPGGRDDTLVPADAVHGVPDIRDKELARLYRDAARKGILLTVIIDACHSGGMSRGVWNRAGSLRNVEPDTRTVHDPPDLDATTGRPLPDPSALGVLTLAAASKGQSAREDVFAEGTNGRGPLTTHGVFSKALADVLASSPTNERVDRIFQRVDALVRTSNTLQEPQLVGTTRRSRALFGQPAGSSNRLTVAVERVNGATITFSGGLAMGLSRGCSLRKLETTARPAKAGSPILAEITDVTGLASATAVLKGSGSVQVGDLFVLERWVAQAGRALRVYFPRQAPAEAEITAVGRAVEAAARTGAITAVALALAEGDERLSAPTHVLSWQGGAWTIEAYPAAGAPIRIEVVTAANIAEALPRGARLCAFLPASREITSALHLGPGTENEAIEVVDSPARADYVLVGRLDRDRLGYAWCLNDVFERTVRDTALPLHTNLSSAGATLTETALRLAKIHGWLTLATPPGGADSFPYRLAFERPGGGTPPGDTVRIGDEFKLVLRADAADLAALKATGVEPRHVYVFSIAVNGEAALLFPSEGNQGNLVPRDAGTERVDLSGRRHDFAIGPPLGHDSYFLVTSDTPLPLDAFQWESVVEYRTRGDRAGIDLGTLLRATGTGSRGRTWPVPPAWSVERRSLVSVR